MANTYKMEAVAESSEAPHIYEDMEVLKNKNKISLKPDEEECNEVADLKVKGCIKKCSHFANAQNNQCHTVVHKNTVIARATFQ